MANITNIQNVNSLQSWDIPVTLHRVNAYPIDNASYFQTLAEARSYAISGATSYVGQQLYVVNSELSTVDTYTILDASGNLEKSATGSEVNYLSSRVSTIEDDIRGGVVYQGHIDLNLPEYVEGLPLSTIFGLYYHVVDPVSYTYLSNMSLKNGWMYNITTDEPYIVSGANLSLENNDYVIIHSHDTSILSIDISALNRSNVDIIEAIYDNVFRVDSSNTVLCANTFNGQTRFNGPIVVQNSIQMTGNVDIRGYLAAGYLAVSTIGANLLSTNDLYIAASPSQIVVNGDTLENYVESKASAAVSVLDFDSPSFYDGSGAVKVLTSLSQVDGQISASVEVLDYSKISGLNSTLSTISSEVDGKTDSVISGMTDALVAAGIVPELDVNEVSFANLVSCVYNLGKLVAELSSLVRSSIA